MNFFKHYQTYNSKNEAIVYLVGANQKLRDLHEEKSDSPKLLEGVQTLYDLALLAEGSKVHDLGGFMKRVQEAVLKGL